MGVEYYTWAWFAIGIFNHLRHLLIDVGSLLSVI